MKKVINDYDVTEYNSGYPIPLESTKKEQKKTEINPNKVGKKIKYEELERIKKSIVEGSDAIVNNHSEVILVIGKTGAGKSTLVNYLTNIDKMRATLYKDPTVTYDEGTLVLDIDDKEKQNFGSPRIGHRKDAETSVPNKWQSQDNVVYWDCPGFGDTAGPVQDIPNAFFIKKIFDTSTKIKLLVVIEFKDIKGKADSVKLLTDSLGNLFNNINDIKHSLVLTVTKVNKDTKMKKILAELTKTINAKCFQEAAQSKGKEILELFINNPEKIAILKKPKEEGPLTGGKNAKLLGSNKEISDTIAKAKFIEVPKVNVSVPDSAKLMVDGLSKDVSAQVASIFSDFTKDIEEICAGKIQKAEEVVEKRTTLNFLKALEKSTGDLIEKASKFEKLEAGVREVAETENSAEFIELFKKEMLAHEGLNAEQTEGFLVRLQENVQCKKFLEGIYPEVSKNFRIKNWLPIFEKFEKEVKYQVDKFLESIGGELYNRSSHIDELEKTLESYIERLKEQIEGQDPKELELNKISEPLECYKEFSGQLGNIISNITPLKVVMPVVLADLNENIFKRFNLEDKAFDTVAQDLEFINLLEGKFNVYETIFYSKLTELSKKIDKQYPEILSRAEETVLQNILLNFKLLTDEFESYIEKEKVLNQVSQALNLTTKFLNEIKSIETQQDFDFASWGQNLEKEYRSNHPSLSEDKNRLLLLKDTEENIEFLRKSSPDFQSVIKRAHEGYLNHLDNLHEKIRQRQEGLEGHLKEKGEEDLQGLIKALVEGFNNIEENQIVSLLKIIKKQKIENNPEFSKAATEFKKQLEQDQISGSLILSKIISKVDEIDKVGGNVKLRLWSEVLNKITEKITPKYHMHVQNKFLIEVLPSFKDSIETLIVNKEPVDSDKSKFYDFFRFLKQTENTLNFTIPNIKGYAQLLLKAISKIRENNKEAVFGCEETLNSIQEDYSISFPEVDLKFLTDSKVNELLKTKIKYCKGEIVKFTREAFDQLGEDIETAIKKTNSYDEKLQAIQELSKAFNKDTSVKDIQEFIKNPRNAYISNSKSYVLFTEKVKECEVNISEPVVAFFNQLVVDKIEALKSRSTMNAEEAQNDEDKQLLIKVIDNFIVFLDEKSQQSAYKEELKTLRYSHFTKSKVSELHTIGEGAERLSEALTSNKLKFEFQDKQQVEKLILKNTKIPLILKDKMSQLGSKIEATLEKIEKNEINTINTQKSNFVRAMNGLIKDITAEVKGLDEDKTKTVSQKLLVVQGIQKFCQSIHGHTTIADIVDVIKSAPCFNPLTQVKFNDFSVTDRIDISTNLTNLLPVLNNLGLEKLEATFKNAQLQETLEKLVDNLIKITNDNLLNEDTILKVISKIESSKNLLQTEFKTIPKIGDFAKSLAQAIDNHSYDKAKLAHIRTNLDNMKIHNDLNINQALINKLKNQVVVFEESKQWYVMLQILHKELNDKRMEIIDNHEVYSKLAKLPQSKYKSELLTKFIVDNNKISNPAIKTFVRNLHLNASKISELTKLKSSIFNEGYYNNSDSVYDISKVGNILKVSGDFVRISAISEKIDTSIKYVYINASSTVYFDQNITKQGVHLNVIAPNWYVAKPCTINLSGKNGNDLGKAQPASGIDSSECGQKGSDGKPGNYGENGGNFYGQCRNIINHHNLKIISNGGNGGKGEDGGDGAKGIDGANAACISLYYYYNEDTEDVYRGYYGTTVNTDFDFVFCNKRDVKIYKLDGTKGTKGGNGGKGGKGGYAGNGGVIKIVDYDSNSLSIAYKANNGKNGIDGEGGQYGTGGRHGDHTVSAWDTRDKVWIKDPNKSCGGYKWSSDGYSTGSSGYAESGTCGAEGTNDSEWIRDPIISINTEDVKIKYIAACKKHLKDQGNNIFTKVLANYAEESLRLNLSGQGTLNDLKEDFGYYPFFNEYYSEGINSILSLRLKDALGNSIKEGKIKILPAKYLFSENILEIDNFNVDNLKILAEDAKELLIQNPEVTALLVPLNLNLNHWVGMVFVINKEQQILQVKYFDSENKPMPSLFLETLISSFANACNDIFININIEQELTEKQISNNCGSEVIENFVQYFTGYRLSQEDAIPMHSLLLEVSLLGGDDFIC